MSGHQTGGGFWLSFIHSTNTHRADVGQSPPRLTPSQGNSWPEGGEGTISLPRLLAKTMQRDQRRFVNGPRQCPPSPAAGQAAGRTFQKQQMAFTQVQPETEDGHHLASHAVTEPGAGNLITAAPPTGPRGEDPTWQDRTRPGASGGRVESPPGASLPRLGFRIFLQGFHSWRKKREAASAVPRGRPAGVWVAGAGWPAWRAEGEGVDVGGGLGASEGQPAAGPRSEVQGRVSAASPRPDGGNGQARPVSGPRHPGCKTGRPGPHPSLIPQLPCCHLLQEALWDSSPAPIVAPWLPHSCVPRPRPSLTP